MNMKEYHLFISHSWSHSDRYSGLVNLLNQAPAFLYHNRSIPEDDPVHNSSNRELSEAIRNKMESCGIVLVLTGVYADYSRWITKEINIAQSTWKRSKPILGIRHWENERVSNTVLNAADAIVDWNTRSIVNAIEELA